MHGVCILAVDMVSVGRVAKPQTRIQPQASRHRVGDGHATVRTGGCQQPAARAAYHLGGADRATALAASPAAGVR